MLALERVTKSYGARCVLNDIDLACHRGELLGFVGGNGAGKTTSMRIMLGVSEADSGRVTLDGAQVDNQMRSRFGYMPEERGLFPAMRLHRQLKFFAELRGVRPKQAADAAEYWLDRLGIFERRDNRLEELSLGNQQRVQLAAALVHEPEVLVLDEPFSGLDPIAVDVMSEVLLEEARRGIPVVFSSHQLELVEHVCDRVAILRSGRVIAQGSVAELTGSAEPQNMIRASAPVDSWLPELTTRLGADKVHRASDDSVLVSATAPELAFAIDTIRAHGDLLELREWRPSLAQVFRKAVEPQPNRSADLSGGEEDVA